VVPTASWMVRVDRAGDGEWEVDLPDQPEAIMCATFDDAQRVAHLCAALRRPCELVVCDAYHRVLQHEFLDRTPNRRIAPQRC
jgi:hypothetical protein